MGNEFDFARGISDFGILADDDIFIGDDALDFSAGFDFRKRHQNTIDDFSSGFNDDTGKEHGIGDLAVDDATLIDVRIGNFGFGSENLGRDILVFGIDLPFRISKIEFFRTV